MQDPKLVPTQCTQEFLESFTELHGVPTGAENTVDESEMTSENPTNSRTTSEEVIPLKTVHWLRKRNLLSPIYQLPLELLQTIFHLVLFSLTGRRRPRYFVRLTTLRSVSWMCRDVITRTPSFWTQLSSTDNIGFISEALKNSHQLPLHLKYVGKAEDREQVSSAFFEETVPHLHRWEHVAIQDPADHYIQKYCSIPAPTLKCLVLSTRLPWLSEGPSPLGALFGGELAGLEELRALLWKEIDWMGFHCRRLKKMEIGGYSMLDMDVLFRIVGENPDLRILLLHFITFRPYPKVTQEHDPIILHKVTEFVLRCVAEVLEEDDDTKLWDAPAVRILRRIRTPACVSFALETIISTRSSVKLQDIFTLIPNPVDTFMRARGQAFRPTDPVVRLSFCDRSLQCRAFGNLGSSPRYDITLQNVSRKNLTSWVRQEFNPEKWVETNLKIHLEYLLDDYQPEIDGIFDFQDWNSVVELDVAGVPNAAEPLGPGLMQKLECPHNSMSGTLTGPFLGLQTLRLSNCAVTGEEILRMVKERFRQITEQPDKVSEDIRSNAIRGLTIILGDGVNRFPGSIVQDISAVAGIKQVQTTSGYNDLNFHPQDSSSESDWYPAPPSSTNGTDEEPEEGLELGLDEESDLSGAE